MKTARKILAVILFTALLLSLSACFEKKEAKLNFELNAAGDGYVLVGMENAKGTVKIPAQNEGLPVTEIATGAFMDGLDITELHLPNSLKVFQKEAFKGLMSLETLYISDIAAWCQIEVAADNVGAVTPYTTPFAYAEEIYIDGVKTSTLIIPEGVTRINGGVFSDLDELFTALSLPSTLQEIGTDAFARMHGVTELTIPGGVTLVEENAFSNCNEIEKLTTEVPNVFFAKSPGIGPKLKECDFRCTKDEFKYSLYPGVLYHFADGDVQG